MSQFTQATLERWAPRAGWLAAGALALALGLLWALEIWRISAVATEQPEFTAGSPGVERGDLLQQIQSAQLFGAGSGAGNDTPQRRNLPQTSVQMTLRGAFAGREPDAGSAIIELPGGPTRSVRAGASIDGDTHLREVYPDHVVLERSGQLESLYFPQPGDDTPQPVDGITGARDGFTAAGELAQGRGEDSEEPAPQPTLSAEERRQKIRQRLEELRQRAANNRNDS